MINVLFEFFSQLLSKDEARGFTLNGGTASNCSIGFEDRLRRCRHKLVFPPVLDATSAGFLK